MAPTDHADAHQDLAAILSFMLITLPFRRRFGVLTEAVKLVAAAVTHATKNTSQSGIEFNPATSQLYIDAVDDERHPTISTSWPPFGGDAQVFSGQPH